MVIRQKKQRVLEAATRDILDSISDGVFTVDLNWRITSFNRAAEEILGVSREEAIGRLCPEVFRSSMCEGNCAMRQTLESGTPVINHACFIIDSNGNRIPISVSTAMLKDIDGKVIGGAETFRDLSEVEALRKELESRMQIGDLVSHSPAMRKVFDLARAVSASSSTVLIQGDTGTGKELLAKAIHGMSLNSSNPFIAVNCGALPDSLLESELFGYKKGAFTGANQNKPGRFALAHNGTIFLDEIGEISTALQVKLLRVLQERTYEPLGATKTEQTTARVIVATNKNLASMVKKDKFREDLFYRINVIKIELPLLSQRKEDIPLLIEYFIDRFNRIQKKKVQGITGEALSLLMAHNWPGNVRELENVIERAFVLCCDASIELKHLPEELTGQLISSHPIAASIHSVRHLAEKQTIISALRNNNFNRSATAQELGIHTSTLFRKMKSLNITFPERDGRYI